MNARTLKADRTETTNSAAMVLLEFEIPNTTAFEAFEAQLDATLAELEEQFSGFVTRNSFAGSIGR